ncbi:MAG: tRNA epoxyqueuosine(34) reductase QueG [SAR202 cluster bacterium Io17-Chloro-G9]|nr:MAG: tRNA epoxyqueuosine(34) reductase QueG [SAR202 cluster bacterium Io17-Chloro-G9]
MSRSVDQNTTLVKQCALDSGFDLVRITSAQEFSFDRQAALTRLGDGLMDGLPWYTEGRIRRGSDPQQLLPGARSIISLGLSYFSATEKRPNDTGQTGKVARYALGKDYHRVMKARMKTYVQTLSSTLETSIDARWYVDDGPMLDRAAAARSGLGWFGKNTNILTPSHGSWVFLGQVVTDLDLVPDESLAKTCGNCVLCIEACPTDAIVEPFVIDNPRCISHLTIENRGPIPIELRPQMEGWVFGCDICQDVCPVNRKAIPAAVPIPPLSSQESPFDGESPGLEESGLIDLMDALDMSEEDFQRRFRNSPIKRAKLVGLQRNACVALGNQADPVATPALLRALASSQPLVRGHAAWALGNMEDMHAREGLEKALELEQDPWVREEIELAMNPG